MKKREDFDDDLEKYSNEEVYEGKVKTPKKKKKRLSFRNIIIIGICIFLLAIFGVLLTVFLVGNSYIGIINKDTHSYSLNTSISIDPSDLVDSDNIDDATRALIDGDATTFYNTGEAAEASYVTNILLIGSDVRVSESWNGNSDSMIMISINSKTKTITMTSFMRDLYVYIPDANVCSKLNYAHAYGGSELLCKTITGNFKVKVDQYFRVDFYGLMDIIDAAGGVDITLRDEELSVANMYIHDMAVNAGYNPDDYYLTTAGTQHLNGVQAVAYARIRYVGNADYERTNRQRTILSQVFENVKSMGITDIDAFAKTALPNLYTNMDNDDIWGIISDALTYLDYDLVSQRVPFDDTSTGQTIDGQSMLVPDYKTNAEMLIESIYGDGQ